MSFRSLASLRVAVSFAALLVLSACSDNRQAQLSAVETIDIPTANTGSQANQNIANPTLVIPDTFPVAEGDELTLVFSEEFDGPEIDPEVWFFATGDGTEKGLPGGWGNNELQYYLPDNAMIVNGVLEITARRETVGNLNYTSARINTEDRFAFKYGRIEASMKLPSGQGLWSAFWMLPQDDDYLCSGEPCIWSAFGEIDIVEAVNLDGTGSNEIFSTIHYGGELPANQSTETRYTPSVDVTEDFHTYTLEWDEDEIRWYFDGALYAVANSWFTDADGQEYPAPFNRPFHILLNLAVGGNFPGSPNGTTPFPATMEVDWVRVYSGEDPDGGAATEPNASAPTPTEDAAGVISIYSDAYDDIAGVNFNPPWNQATVFTEAQIAGNKMLKYAGLDYQGIDFAGNPQDVSSKGYLHLDFWTADSTALNVYLISPGPAETAYALTVTPNSWVSVDIPLSEFAGVDLTNLIQMKFDGNGTVFVDNLYFAGDAPIVEVADPGTTPEFVLFGTTAPADVPIPEGGPQNFGSGASFDFAFADTSFDPVIAVTAGTDYGPDTWVAFLAVTGYTAGFTDGFDTFTVKVKDSPLGTVEVKLIGGGDDSVATVDVTTYAGSTELGDGWYELNIPFSEFSNPANIPNHTGWLIGPPGDQGDAVFVFLMTDVGFSSTAVTADPGTTPGFVLFGTTAAADVPIPEGGPQNFGSGASFDFAFADTSFDPAIAVTAGTDYGPDTWVAFLAVTGYTAGFTDGFDTFTVKVKDSPLGTVEVKLIGGGDDSVATVDVTTYAGSTELGDGWYELNIPFSEFSNPANIPNHTGWLVGPPGDQGDAAFVFLMTDVGFSSTAVTADPGTTPGFVLFGTTAAADVPIPEGGPQNFGSGASFDFAFADTSFDPAIAVTAGTDYGPDTWVAFLAVTGYTAGFTDGFDTFTVKVKDSPLGTVEVKLIGGGDDSVATVDVTTYAGSTELGDGWYELNIPFSEFSNPANIPNHTGWLVGPPGDQGDAVFVFLMTDVGFSSAGGADHGAGTAGVITETATESPITVLSITNSNEFGGNDTVADAESTAIPAFEGAVVLSITYNDSSSTYGGAVLNYGGIDLTAYDTLNFTIDTSGITGFADLTIQMEPPGAGADGTKVLLSSYSPVATSGNWATYAIPLADFPVTNFAAVDNLGFWNPVDGSGLAFGVLYVDDVYYSTEAGSGADHGAGTAGVITETATESPITVLSITNSNEFGGNDTVADAESTAIPAFEGAVVLSITYNDSSSTYGGAVLNYGGIDLTAYDTLNFTIDTSGITGFADLTIQMEPPGAGADGTKVLLSSYSPVATSGNWATYAIPLADFPVTNFAAVDNLGFWNPVDGSGLAFGVLYVDDVYYSTEGGSGGGTFVNGDFETGDFTGWTQTPQGGSITLDSSEQGGRAGTVARLVATGSAASAQDVLLSQVDLTEINSVSISGSDSVTVSADVFGTLAGAGGVVFIELISRNSGGDETGRSFIGPAPIFPTTTWTPYSSTVNVAADVSGGVTLQLKSSCGAVDGCVVDASFDNVTITIN